MLISCLTQTISELKSSIDSLKNLLKLQKDWNYIFNSVSIVIVLQHIILNKTPLV